MKPALTAKICFVLLLFPYIGCRPSPPIAETLPRDDTLNIPVCVRYAPVAIDILPLTDFLVAGRAGENSVIDVYVALLDSFSSQIKAPGSFRFELYEYAQRSAEPRGKRVTIWPDIDLTDPEKNNDYWQDFLRAYHFELPIGQPQSQSYILQVTCLCPSGKRLSAELALRQTK